MEFYTQWKRPKRKREDFSNENMKTYKKKINKETGKKELVIDKTINIREKIKEYTDEVSITKTIEKYNLNPIESLKKQEGKIIDLTNVPENLMEMQNEILKAKEIWNGLSKKTKMDFDNNINIFLASSENGKLTNYIQEKLAKPVNQGTSGTVNPGTSGTVNPGTSGTVSLSIEEYNKIIENGGKL